MGEVVGRIRSLEDWEDAQSKAQELETQRRNTARENRNNRKNAVLVAALSVALTALLTILARSYLT
jgi:hypothetical protein